MSKRWTFGVKLGSSSPCLGLLDHPVSTSGHRGCVIDQSVRPAFKILGQEVPRPEIRGLTLPPSRIHRIFGQVHCIRDFGSRRPDGVIRREDQPCKAATPVCTPLRTSTPENPSQIEQTNCHGILFRQRCGWARDGQVPGCTPCHCVQGRIQDFGQGGPSGVLTQGGHEPKICLK